MSFRVDAQNKFSPKFAATTNGRHTSRERFSVSVKNNDAFQAHYRQKINIVSHHADAKIFVVSGSIDFIVHEFALDDNVIFVDIVGVPTEEAPNSFLNVAVNRINKAKHEFPTLLGANQVVSIKENNFDATDLDLLGKSISTPFASAVVSQHATSMATYIVGLGNSSEKGEGVATAAKITSSDFINLLPDPDNYFETYQIRLQNHSYGVAIENYYGNEAVAYDQHVFTNPEVLHIFSAGNSGTATPSSGQYKDLNWANLSGNFKQAKNVLVVTAVDTSMRRNVINSRGPAYDGRLKPELTAHGQGGTSDAAALTSGMAVLVQDAFVQRGHEQPSSAMVKATLIASADDIGSIGPDFTFGYGNVNLFQAIQDVKAGTFATQVISGSESKTVSITIPPATRELRIATVWIDAPAGANESKALVHDIDTYLEYNGEQVHPWTLSHFPHGDSLAAAAKRKPDHLNNVEFISIENPLEGSYDLVLQGNGLPNETTAAVAYSLRPDIFSWDYPYRDEVMEANTRTKLLWSQPLKSSGTLWLKLNTAAWEIVGQVPVGVMSYTWDVPGVFSAAALRLTVDGENFESAEFVISPKIDVNVLFDCDESFALSWNAVDGASTYEIKVLSDASLIPLQETSDTVAIFEDEPRQYFTVIPMIGSKAGSRAETINKGEQGAGCYINYFTAYRFDEQTNKLDLALSTTWNVSKIIFYRVAGDVRIPWKTITPVANETAIEIFDEKLSSGIMSYAVDVELSSGAVVAGNVVDVMVEEKGKALLYPNPTFDGTVHVLSEGSGRVIEIFDREGKLLMRSLLELYIETLDVRSLAPGLYLYRMRDDGNVVDSGRLLKM